MSRRRSRERGEKYQFSAVVCCDSRQLSVSEPATTLNYASRRQGRERGEIHQSSAGVFCDRRLETVSESRRYSGFMGVDDEVANEVKFISLQPSCVAIVASNPWVRVGTTVELRESTTQSSTG